MAAAENAVVILVVVAVEFYKVEQFMIAMEILEVKVTMHIVMNAQEVAKNLP